MPVVPTTTEVDELMGLVTVNDEEESDAAAEGWLLGLDSVKEVNTDDGDDGTDEGLDEGDADEVVIVTASLEDDSPVSVVN